MKTLTLYPQEHRGEALLSLVLHSFTILSILQTQVSDFCCEWAVVNSAILHILHLLSMGSVPWFRVRCGHMHHYVTHMTLTCVISGHNLRSTCVTPRL